MTKGKKLLDDFIIISEEYYTKPQESLESGGVTIKEYINKRRQLLIYILELESCADGTYNNGSMEV